VKQETAALPAGTLEPLVYEAMTRDGFAEFRERYLGRWFKKRDEPR
jgi:hypothetical protein